MLSAWRAATSSKTPPLPDDMSRILLIRAAALYLPATAVIYAWMAKRPEVRARAGLLLASLWVAIFLVPVNLIAMRFGWWEFHATGGLFLGIPVDFLFGWALLWGCVPLLLLPRTSVWLSALLALAFDVAFMPALEPALQLNRHWLAGEVLAITLCFVPAQLLARWTAERRHLYGRALLQVVLFSGLVNFALPAIALANTSSNWTPLFARPWWQFGVLAQMLAIPGILGLSAVYEFATRGRGTPLPYDPPERIVTSGAYGYVANPMQMSATLLLVLWAAALHSAWIAAAAVMAHIYSAGIAAFDERDSMRQRFGDEWVAYRKHVRNWIPRWRPWHPSPLMTSGNTRGIAPRLYVSQTCGMCSEVRRWFEQRGVTALEIVPAEQFPGEPLERMTYDPRDGSAIEDGVAALARALEHIHLGWAFAGFAMRLPIVRQALQFLVDASGGEPRRIPRQLCRPAGTLGRL
jgi:protein-S-isoprenylcysteine O-methyltransferase Ste14